VCVCVCVVCVGECVCVWCVCGYCVCVLCVCAVCVCVCVWYYMALLFTGNVSKVLELQSEFHNTLDY
jgi:hypothetical protein